MSLSGVAESDPQRRRAHGQPSRQGPASIIDAFLSSVSALGDTLGQALEPLVDARVREGQQYVRAYTDGPESVASMASDILLGAPESRALPEPSPSSLSWSLSSGGGGQRRAETRSHRDPADRPRNHRRSDALSQSRTMSSNWGRPRGNRAIEKGEGVDHGSGSTAPGGLFGSGATSLNFPRREGGTLADEAFDPSRSLVSVMAVRAKELNAEWTEARESLAEAHDRNAELEEELVKLRREMSEGQSWDPSEAEEQLREQVEQLLLDKSALEKAKRDLERRNRELSEQVQVLLDQQLQAEYDGEGGTRDPWTVEGMGYDAAEESSEYTYTPHDGSEGYSPLCTPGGSTADLMLQYAHNGELRSVEENGGGETSGSKGLREELHFPAAAAAAAGAMSPPDEPPVESFRTGEGSVATSNLKCALSTVQRGDLSVCNGDTVLVQADSGKMQEIHVNCGTWRGKENADLSEQGTFVP